MMSRKNHMTSGKFPMNEALGAKRPQMWLHVSQGLEGVKAGTLGCRLSHITNWFNGGLMVI